MTTSLPPRLSVARLPTPIRLLERLSADLVPTRIWVKHDDETGGVLGGNKVRKLEYVVREAIDAGADTLITCGGIQSNHCRTTAALARRVGLDVVLCLRGQPPARLEGNLLLDHVLGANVRWLTPSEYETHDAYMATVADELRTAGKRPFVITEGASMPMGCFGYIEAAQEIAAFETEHSLRFDAIVCACGSGGTGAGLELGVRLTGRQTKVVHMAVCDDASHFRRKIAQLCADTNTRFDLGVTVSEAAIDVVDDHVGGGYGLASSEQLTHMTGVARREGLVLDPVYSGKAFFGLCRDLAAGKLIGREILFVHTGGLFGLFPFADALPR